MTFASKQAFVGRRARTSLKTPAGEARAITALGPGVQIAKNERAE